MLRTGAAEFLVATPVQYWEKRARTIKGNREVAYQASSAWGSTARPSTSLSLLRSERGRGQDSRRPLLPLLAVRYDSSVAGAIVMEVDPQSPAAAAKLQPSDIVVAILGRRVRSAKRFRQSSSPKPSMRVPAARSSSRSRRGDDLNRSEACHQARPSGNGGKRRRRAAAKRRPLQRTRPRPSLRRYCSPVSRRISPSSSSSEVISAPR